ncbi:MAG: hypothetical protein IPO08_19545 [Xanthomonadales bacterium]|nr:hypothetical protein [Xanthomonadales bacterium]
MAGQYNTTGYRNSDGNLTISEQIAGNAGHFGQHCAHFRDVTGVITTFGAVLRPGEAQFTAEQLGR